MMAAAAAILKAVAAAFTVAPWLRTTAFVLIAFGFGFIKGCNTGRSWAKQPEPAKVERPIRRPILPWRQAEVPQLPAVIEAATVPVVPAQTKQTQRPAAANCANGQCGPMRRGLFGRWR
jgi:hypothetical protein